MRQFDQKKLFEIFQNSPKIAFKPHEIANKRGWRKDSTRRGISKLHKKGLIKRNPDNSYTFIPEIHGKKLLEDRGNTVAEMRGTTEIPPASKIKIKAHDLGIERIDLSDYIEYMKNFNMLKSPGTDNAQNVGLRAGVLKKSNLRVCLKNPANSAVYPHEKGWKDELVVLFNNDPAILDRLKEGDVVEKVAVALEFESLKRYYPQFQDIEFEDLKHLVIRGEDGYIEFCKSQFEDGEICIHGDTKQDTQDIMSELMEGTLQRATTLNQIREEIARLPFTIVQIMGDQVAKAVGQAVAENIEKAVAEGIKKGLMAYDAQRPIKPDEKKDVV